MIKPLRAVLSGKAVEDLSDIYNYIAEHDPLAAERLVNAITSKIMALAATGNSGVSRGQILPGLRAFPFKQRCIYFRLAGDVLHVVRVLHGRQDIEPEMFETEDET